MTGGPGLFTIPAGVPFVDALAAGILTETTGDPLALADYVILLPTRRACRSLREGFLRVTAGEPLLLPRMQPIGDVAADDVAMGEDSGLESLDLPPAVSDQRRMLLLARLILQWDTALNDAARTAMTPDHAVRLARELARLIDQVQTERLSFDALDALGPERVTPMAAGTGLPTFPVDARTARRVGNGVQLGRRVLRGQPLPAVVSPLIGG